MVKNHLKSLAAPNSWTLKKKTGVYAVRSNPGGHTFLKSIPVSILFKNVLKLAKTTKEVKLILHDKKFIVNGKRKRDHRMPVGLFDIISFPEADLHYMLTIDKKGKICANKITKDDAKTKISKITKKVLTKKGLMLGFMNGSCTLVKEDKFKTGDSAVIDIVKKKVKDILELKKGAPVLLVGGKHIGLQGTLDSIEGNKVIVKLENGLTETIKKYVVVIGKTKPLITI